MNVGLDLGAHAFRSLWRDGDHLQALHTRSIYAVVPDSDVQRHLLDQAAIRYAVCQGNLVLIGRAALELGKSFQTPCISLLPGGRIPMGDPLGRQILAMLVDQHLPRATAEGGICCFASPPTPQATLATPSDRDLFCQLIRLQGYSPLPLPAGMAVVLAELVPDRFNGLGCVFGAASCEFSLSYQGREIISCSVPLGGDWIDEQFARQAEAYCWDPAGNQLLDLEAVAAAKEELTASIVRPTNEAQALLSQLYAELVTHAVQEAARTIARCLEQAHARPAIDLICCGGAARIPGFAELMAQVLRKVSFPLPVRDIRLGNLSPYTVARGCLINAELESQHRLSRDRVA